MSLVVLLLYMIRYWYWGALIWVVLLVVSMHAQDAQKKRTEEQRHAELLEAVARGQARGTR